MVAPIDFRIRERAAVVGRLGDPVHQLRYFLVELSDNALEVPLVGEILDVVVEQDCGENIGVANTQMYKREQSARTQVRREVSVTTVSLLCAERPLRRVVRAPDKPVLCTRGWPILANTRQEPLLCFGPIE